MSEMEDLKKSAEQSKRDQQIKDVNEYLMKLFEDLEIAWLNKLRNEIAFTSAMLVWLITVYAKLFIPSVWADWNESIADLLFWLMAFRTFIFVLPWYFETMREIRGARKVLELLGYVDPLPPSSRKKIKIKEESFIAKAWDAARQKMREQAWRPV